MNNIFDVSLDTSLKLYPFVLSLDAGKIRPRSNKQNLCEFE